MPAAHLVSERCQPVIMDFGLGMYTVREMGQTDICTLLLLLGYWLSVVTLLLVAIQNIFYLVCRKPPSAIKHKWFDWNQRVLIDQCFVNVQVYVNMFDLFDLNQITYFCLLETESTALL